MLGFSRQSQSLGLENTIHIKEIPKRLITADLLHHGIPWSLARSTSWLNNGEVLFSAERKYKTYAWKCLKEVRLIPINNSKKIRRNKPQEHFLQGHHKLLEDDCISMSALTQKFSMVTFFNSLDIPPLFSIQYRHSHYHPNTWYEKKWGK